MGANRSCRRPAGVSLPDAAERVAELDGVHVLFIALPPSGTNRVRKAEVDATARHLSEQLGDDLLLVFTNPSANQLHIILPSLEGSRPTLRRMVVERDLARRSAGLQHLLAPPGQRQHSYSPGPSLRR